MTGQERIPSPGRVRVVAAVIERDGELLVCQRPAHKRHGGLWEFPGGKTEQGESDLDAVRRELREELDVEVLLIGAEIFRMEDAGSEFTIAFLPTTIDGEPRCIEHEALLWANPDALLELRLAPSDEQFVRSILASGRTPQMIGFEIAVSDTMVHAYGITWAEASGEERLLRNAMEDGQSAEEFVRWFGGKYDLQARSDFMT